jgi:hypothetical protein
MGEVDEAGRYSCLAVEPQRKYTISAIERYLGTLVVLLPAISDLLTTSCSHESLSTESIGSPARF